jgi:glycerol-3-phosphate acyltransferase PlsY
MPSIGQFQSADWGQVSIILFSAYLLGCFTGGYYLVRIRTGQDMRELGSGSLGARNAGRILGWPGFLLTFLSDFAKGALAVWAVRQVRPEDWLAGLVIIAVVAGHIWPAQLRFHGGKGIATSLGAIVVFDYQLAVACGILFACSFMAVRRIVLSGLLAFVCLPLVCTYWNQPFIAVEFSALAGLLLLAHRKNLVGEIIRFLGLRTVQPNHDHSKP